MYAIESKQKSKNISSAMYLANGIIGLYWTNGGFKRFDTKLQAKQEAIKVGLADSQYKVVKI